MTASLLVVIVASAMVIAGIVLVWAVSAALALYDLAYETMQDRRNTL